MLPLHIVTGGGGGGGGGGGSSTDIKKYEVRGINVKPDQRLG